MPPSISMRRRSRRLHLHPRQMPHAEAAPMSDEAAGGPADGVPAIEAEAAPQPASDEAAPGVEEADFLDDEHDGSPTPIPLRTRIRGADGHRLRRRRALARAAGAARPWPCVPPLPPLLAFPEHRPEPAGAAAAQPASRRAARPARTPATRSCRKPCAVRAPSRPRSPRRRRGPSRSAAATRNGAAGARGQRARAGCSPTSTVATRAPGLSGDGEASSFWGRVAVRRSLVAAAVLAALALVVQVLHQERDLIVARQPALAPGLEALCGLTGCEFSALRQIGDITIDGASFAREKNGDGYRLSFTLRNAAAVPLAMPAVELSLLDTQERAVVRRVLLPADFGAPAVLAAACRSRGIAAVGARPAPRSRDAAGRGLSARGLLSLRACRPRTSFSSIQPTAFIHGSSDLRFPRVRHHHDFRGPVRRPDPS